MRRAWLIQRLLKGANNTAPNEHPIMIVRRPTLYSPCVFFGRKKKDDQMGSRFYKNAALYFASLNIDRVVLVPSKVSAFLTHSILMHQCDVSVERLYCPSCFLRQHIAVDAPLVVRIVISNSTAPRQ